MAVRRELAPGFQRRQWLVQRTLWVVAALVLLAAVLGLFGGGILSGSSEKVEGDGFVYELSYNRWNRQKNPQELKLDVSGADLAGETLEVTLPGSFLDDVQVEGVTPDPESTRLTHEGAVYAWSLDEGEAFSVSFRYRAEEWRQVEGDVLVSTGGPAETLSFSQFLFP